MKKSLALKAAILLALSAPMLVSAESQFTSSGGASARLEMQVNIPRILFLGVGTGSSSLTNDTTIDALTFDYSGAPADVGSGTASTAQGVAVRVLGNNGQISLAAAGSGTGLSNGSDTIAWSEITATSSDATNLNVPGVGGTAAPVLNSARVTSRSATWNFAYANTNVVAPGTYAGQITYTATMP